MGEEQEILNYSPENEMLKILNNLKEKQKSLEEMEMHGVVNQHPRPGTPQAHSQPGPPPQYQQHAAYPPMQVASAPYPQPPAQVYSHPLPAPHQVAAQNQDEGGQDAAKSLENLLVGEYHQKEKRQLEGQCEALKRQNQALRDENAALRRENEQLKLHGTAQSSASLVEMESRVLRYKGLAKQEKLVRKQLEKRLHEREQEAAMLHKRAELEHLKFQRAQDQTDLLRKAAGGALGLGGGTYGAAPGLLGSGDSSSAEIYNLTSHLQNLIEANSDLTKQVAFMSGVNQNGAVPQTHPNQNQQVHFSNNNVNDQLAQSDFQAVISKHEALEASLKGDIKNLRKMVEKQEEIERLLSGEVRKLTALSGEQKQLIRRWSPIVRDAGVDVDAELEATAELRLAAVPPGPAYEKYVPRDRSNLPPTLTLFGPLPGSTLPPLKEGGKDLEEERGRSQSPSHTSYPYTASGTGKPRSRSRTRSSSLTQRTYTGDYTRSEGSLTYEERLQREKEEQRRRPSNTDSYTRSEGSLTYKERLQREKEEQRRRPSDTGSYTRSEGSLTYEERLQREKEEQRRRPSDTGSYTRSEGSVTYEERRQREKEEQRRQQERRDSHTIGSSYYYYSGPGSATVEERRREDRRGGEAQQEEDGRSYTTSYGSRTETDAHHHPQQEGRPQSAATSAYSGEPPRHGGEEESVGSSYYYGTRTRTEGSETASLRSSYPQSAQDERRARRAAAPHQGNGRASGTETPLEEQRPQGRGGGGSVYSDAHSYHSSLGTFSRGTGRPLDPAPAAARRPMPTAGGSLSYSHTEGGGDPVSREERSYTRSASYTRSGSYGPSTRGGSYTEGSYTEGGYTDYTGYGPGSASTQRTGGGRGLPRAGSRVSQRTEELHPPPPASGGRGGARLETTALAAHGGGGTDTGTYSASASRDSRGPGSPLSGSATPRSSRYGADDARSAFPTGGGGGGRVAAGAVAEERSYRSRSPGSATGSGTPRSLREGSATGSEASPIGPSPRHGGGGGGSVQSLGTFSQGTGSPRGGGTEGSLTAGSYRSQSYRSTASPYSSHGGTGSESRYTASVSGTEGGSSMYSGRGREGGAP